MVFVFGSVGYILNVTKEIDNFFPESFTYMNIRVYDVEATDLLSYWNNTNMFISEARCSTQTHTHTHTHTLLLVIVFAVCLSLLLNALVYI